MKVKSPFYSKEPNDTDLFDFIKFKDIVLIYSETGHGKKLLTINYLTKENIDFFFFNFKVNSSYLTNHTRIREESFIYTPESSYEFKHKFNKSKYPSNSFEALEMILDEVFKHIPQKVVIIDELFFLFPHNYCFENYNHMKKVLKILKTNAEKYNKLLIIFTAKVKKEKKTNLINAMGSKKAYIEICDHIIKLIKENKNLVYLIPEVSKRGNFKSKKLILNDAFQIVEIKDV